MLGRNVVGLFGNTAVFSAPYSMQGSGRLNAPVPPPIMRPQGAFINAPTNPQIEQRLDEMNRRLDRLIKIVEEMSKTSDQRGNK
jgi:hypothetical protein